MWLFWLLILIIGIAIFGVGVFLRVFLYIGIAILVVWLIALLLMRRGSGRAGRAG